MKFPAFLLPFGALLALSAAPAGAKTARATKKASAKKVPAKKPAVAVKKPTAATKPVKTGGIKPAPAVATAPPITSTVLINATTRNDAASTTTLLLAEDGQAKLPIVISAKASDGTRAVAAELASYLKQITGATFEVETGDGAHGIVIGNLAEFPTPALDKALEIRGFDGREAYAIRIRPDKLMLLGATDMGVSHAAFRLLHEMGCRWFFPHKAWEVVPTTKTLSFGRDITDRPQVLARTIWFEAGAGSAKNEKDYADWRRHNLAAESFSVFAGHNLFAVQGAFKAEFDAHPEYYPLLKQADGTMKRDPSGGQLELGNPRVRELISQYAVDFFKQNPKADMVSLEPADSNSYSQSKESLAMGSVSNQVYTMANEAARALQKAYPGQNKMIGMLSYNSTYDPPTFKLEPNVHVQMASIGANPKYTPQERFKLWPMRSNNLGVYEYYSVFLWANENLPGSYANGVRDNQRHIRDELAKSGIVSMSAESTSSWGSNGRGYYVANALLWNPDLDLKALLQDFYTKAFGPGAPMMERYYERLSPDNNPLMSASLLGQAFRDVDEASRAAADRPDVQARLDQIKLYLHFVALQFRKWNEGENVPMDSVMETLYRSNEYALTAWSMIAQTWGGETLYPKNKFADWPALVPYDHEEIETNFQDALKRFVPRIRDDLQPRQTFSQDLVAVRWPDKAEDDKPTQQNYQGSMKYALWSVKGEPLQFTTTAGDAWGYKTSFEVTDADGKVIASGKPEAKVAVEHKIAVPKPGLYYLNYGDPGAYWEFKAKPGLIYSIVMLPEVTGGRTARAFDKMYIYVPKGVKKLEYFATGGAWVYGPDGKSAKRVERGNDWITIDVPDGMDGKLWTLNGFDIGKYYFSNVPSYFAPRPEGVLVPREVAVKDGLPLLK